MTASFTAYIDESGDEGFVFHPEERGSSRWLVLSAVVFRKSNDLHAVRIMRDARVLLKKEPKRKTALGYGLKFWPEDFDTLADTLPHLDVFKACK